MPDETHGQVVLCHTPRYWRMARSCGV